MTRHSLAAHAPVGFHELVAPLLARGGRDWRVAEPPDFGDGPGFAKDALWTRRTLEYNVFFPSSFALNRRPPLRRDQQPQKNQKKNQVNLEKRGLEKRASRGRDAWTSRTRPGLFLGGSVTSLLFQPSSTRRAPMPRRAPRATPSAVVQSARIRRRGAGPAPRRTAGRAPEPRVRRAVVRPRADGSRKARLF